MRNAHNPSTLTEEVKYIFKVQKTYFSVNKWGWMGVRGLGRLPNFHLTPFFVSS